MRIAIMATVAAALALFAASMIGVASAEAPAPTTTVPATIPPAPLSTPPRTVDVEGVADVPVAQDSNTASATAAYRQAMAAAVSDGQGKAEFLVGKAGATLGSVQSVGEDGGNVECSGEEGRYLQYEGEQPDFGSPSPTLLPESAAAAAPPTASATPSHRASHRPRKRHPSAKKASVSTCSLQARVSLVYTID